MENYSCYGINFPIEKKENKQSISFKGETFDLIQVNGKKVPKFQFRDRVDIPSTQYLTHNIHHHPAKFIPQIPRYFIEKYSKNKDDIILDPFAGSGTTLVEAMHKGKDAIGIEINPLSKLIAKVKTTPISPKVLEETNELLESLNEKVENRMFSDYLPKVPNMDHWFEKNAKKQLSRIKKIIEEYFKSLEYFESKKDVLDLLKICFSVIVRKASNADPRISKYTRTKKMRKKLEEGRDFNLMNKFLDLYKKKSDSIKKLHETINSSDSGNVEIIEGDARKLEIEKNVDIIITSPPFINAQNYFRSFKLQLFWLELIDPEKSAEFDSNFIGTNRVYKENYEDLHKTGLKELDECLEKVYEKDKKRAYVIYKYFAEDMKKNLQRAYEILDPGGRYCITLGDNEIRGITIPTHKFIIDIAKGVGEKGFDLEFIGADEIKNYSLSPRRNDTASIIDVEWGIVLKKPN
ncbi:MAG: DNA methyltransferase [Promethearchaeia archaeon]